MLKRFSFRFFVGCLCNSLILSFILGGFVSIVVAKQPVPYPQDKLLKKTVWPPAVYLGEPFSLRLVLRHRERIASVRASKKIGLAHVRGPIELRQRDQKWILKIPLSMYVVQTYGVQKLPSFSLSFQQPDGKRQVWTFPAFKVEVRARYAATQSFRLRDDPMLPFLAKSRNKLAKNQNKQPSHEWRILPEVGTPQKRHSWFEWFAAGLLLVGLSLVFWVMWKRRSTKEKPSSPHDVYAEAILRLEQLLNEAHSEQKDKRRLCDQILRLLRGYLHSRLSAPLCHLTAKELCQVLEMTSPVEGLLALQRALVPERLGWHPLLKTILLASESLCFAPVVPDKDSFLKWGRDVRRLIDSVEAWQKEREQHAADETLSH